MPITIDGDNLLIILGTETELNVSSAIYSTWKDWFRTSDNAKYPVAFDTTGGDPLGAVNSIAAYYFLRNDNGWRIRPPEQDIEVRFIGNLFRREPSEEMFIPTLGDFTVSLELEISPQALTLGFTDLEALVQQTLAAAQSADAAAQSADTSAQSADTAAQSADTAAQSADANAQAAAAAASSADANASAAAASAASADSKADTIIDLEEADEELSPTEAKKLKKGTAQVLITKIVTGGSLTNNMTLKEPP